MSSFHPTSLPKWLPEDRISGASHLLTNISPSALSRADGCIPAALQIEDTSGKVEALLAA